MGARCAGLWGEGPVHLLENALDVFNHPFAYA
jgi:hypothetical protein